MLFIWASLVLMTADHRFGHLESVRSALSVFVYPIQYLVNLPARFYHWAGENLVTDEALLRANQRLRDEQLQLQFKLQKYEVLEMENQRLRKLLESSRQLSDKVLIAELINVDLQHYRHTILINKGDREGVFDGQTIVDADGIMGQVVHVSPFSSTVLLITDPSHAIPVQINRNGLRGIAVGAGKNHKLQLEHLPNNADIRKGDLIVSSGLGNHFPAGYPVGVVTDIHLDPAEPFAKVMVTPSAKLEQSREVLLLWPPEHAHRMNRQNDNLADLL